MFGRADRRRAKRAVSNLVSAGTRITGTIQFSGDLRIDGEVRGSVRSVEGESGMLIIGDKARVAGDIDVARLIVRGAITGRVNASEFVKFRPTADVHCDLAYAAVEIHSGAVVEGQMWHRRLPAPSEESPDLIEAQPAHQD